MKDGESLRTKWGSRMAVSKAERYESCFKSEEILFDAEVRSRLFHGPPLQHHNFLVMVRRFLLQKD